MKAFETLPEGYGEFYTVDLQKDKKMSLVVNLLAAVIAVLMIVPTEEDHRGFRDGESRADG